MQLDFQELEILITLRLEAESYSMNSLCFDIKNSYGSTSLYHQIQFGSYLEQQLREKRGNQY